MFLNRRLSWSAIWRGQTEDCPHSSERRGPPSVATIPSSCRAAWLQRHFQPLGRSCRSPRFVGLCGAGGRQPGAARRCRPLHPQRVSGTGVRRLRSVALPGAAVFCRCRRGSPFSAIRWAASRRFTPSIAIWRRNILPSAFGRDRLLPGVHSPKVSLTAPTLILTGESDDWTPAERCREMVAHARPDSAPIALHVYPDAHHAFDVAALQPGRRAFGHSVEYNEAAAKDAAEKTRAFLAAHLAETSPAVGNKR